MRRQVMAAFHSGSTPLLSFAPRAILLAPISRPAMGLAGLALSAWALACGESTSSPPGLTVRDSAGIEIVHSAEPQWGPDGEAWAPSPEPILQIGKVEGDEEFLFSLVVDVELGQDNEVWVADGGINAIRIYDAGGAYLRAVGGEGEGPGEFMGLQGLERGSDFVLAYQNGMSPVAVFDLSGALRGTHRLDPRTDPGSPNFAGVLEDQAGVQAVLFNYPQGDPNRTGLYEQDGPVYTDVLGTDSTREFGVFPMARYVAVPGRGRTPYWQEYGPSLVLATGASGLFVSWSVDYSVTQFTPAGNPIRIIRRDWVRLPVTDEDRETFASSMLTFPGGRTPPPQALEFRRQVVEAMVFPEVHPPLDRLLADSEGNLWVRRHEPHRESLAVRGRPPRIPNDTTVWDVFNPQGVWLGSLSLPGRFALASVGADRLAGIWLGDMDVEYVRVYGLEKP